MVTQQDELKTVKKEVEEANDEETKSKESKGDTSEHGQVESEVAPDEQSESLAT